MRTITLGASIAGALLVLGVTSTGCVADRPSRNGVFDENQYVRKDFLIQGPDANGNAPGADPGWFVRATVTEVSTPNLLGGIFNVFSGAESEVSLVRWRVTQDKLQLLDQIQLSAPVNPDPVTGAPGTTTQSGGVTDAIDNAWPITNVDLKYQINLDGEKSNFYQENQELDWQVRQYVKVNFDKNDFSDFAPLGPQTVALLNQCADIVDASATLVANSFVVEGQGDDDLSNDYMAFTVQVAVPLAFTDSTCLTAYGAALANAQTVGRTEVTVNLNYAFRRALPLTDKKSTYVPFPIGEKDPIRAKYGPIIATVFNRDNDTGLLAAQQFVSRFDPAKPINWYFDQNFPEYYKPVFLGTDGNPGIMQQTNALLTTAGVAARVNFLNYNDSTVYQDKKGTPRYSGDLRYNFVRWVADQDTEDQFVAVTMPGIDPRTGEVLNGVVQFNDQALKDIVVQRIDAFLTQVGGSQGLLNPGWQSGPCSGNSTQQIVNQTVVDLHNASSTLFTKMQQYLGLHGPNPGDDHLGPQDFVATQDADFDQAYFALIPYELFADPDQNLFVTREGGQGVFGPAATWQLLQQETTFQQLSATMMTGGTPFQLADGSPGTAAAASFANQMRDATLAHERLQQLPAVIYPNMHMDAPGAFSIETVMEQDAQRCVNGTWETQDVWTQRMIDTFWQQVFWHEFGHSMGLDHNFMASVDKPNFTTQRDSGGNALTDANGNTLYNMYSSSIMEYNSTPAGSQWVQGWGTYDQGAIAWMYANNGPQADDPTKDAAAVALFSRSGEVAGGAPGQEYPYADPLGFCNPGDPDCTAGQERRFLRCDATHIKYSPICRMHDLGTTPSQIIANDIEDYEWQYPWRNFRLYRKVWNNAEYANQVDSFITDQRRFMAQWVYDWNPGDLENTLYRIGVRPNPTTSPSAVDYYAQLTQKFLTEMSKANQMVAAFDEAVIQQSAGERPYATIYDKFYGDVTQQGIILDKYLAMQTFVGLWPVTNYDPNQAGGYISTWGSFDYDDSFQSVAETAISSMIGSQYAVYPYFIPTAVALFAQDTHNPAFLENGNSGIDSAGTRIEAKDWIGGWVFTREQDLIDYFKTIAVSSGGPPAYTNLPKCLTFEGCAYDVTDPRQVNQDAQTGQFIGPDDLTYVYAYIPSRNDWVVARQDRNIATFKVIENYNTDLFATKDDGTMGAYSDEYQIKYTIDAYEAYENGVIQTVSPTTGTSSTSTDDNSGD
jgi:hypothetical protein